MGKYIKKLKIAGDVSVKDISHPTTTFSSRTRAAKSLALHRLRSHSTSPSKDSDSFHYLQLRSRRLVKLPLLADSRKQQQQQQCDNECQSRRNPRAKSTPAKKSEADTTAPVTETEEDCNFGEKGYNFESGSRRSRETTLCSNSIRDSKAIQSVVPSSTEIEDFFAYAEQEQHRFFIEKYNFDVVSENPLPGRYEWVKVVP